MIYKNITNQSGVLAYEVGSDYISVTFKEGIHRTYTYTYKGAGRNNVERMKSLAALGRGLNSFINTNCKTLYSAKI